MSRSSEMVDVLKVEIVAFTARLDEPMGLGKSVKSTTISCIRRGGAGADAASKSKLALSSSRRRVAISSNVQHTMVHSFVKT